MKTGRIVLRAPVFNDIESRNINMNKSELIDAVASGADLSKADATRATDAVLDSIIETLGKGDQVNLVGFGTFTAFKDAVN
jgi:nucleoid DNA-binding protein